MYLIIYLIIAKYSNLMLKAMKYTMHACVLSCFSHVWLFVMLWTVACQAPLSMGFSRQEYWSRVSCSPSEDLPDQGIESVYLKSPALTGGFLTTSSTWEALKYMYSGSIPNWRAKSLKVSLLYYVYPSSCTIYIPLPATMYRSNDTI